MKAARLLQHYERIADAPDAIARLRRFILDLAGRGNLTSYRIKEAEILPLAELSEFIMGQAPPGNSYNESGQGTVFVKVGEFGERFPVHAAWTTEPLKFAKRGDVLICVVGATIGKLNLAIDCAIGRSVAAIRPQPRLDQVFLYYSLMPVTMRLREDSRGTAQGVISRSDLASIPIWCPPLAEQRRIVAKVDELMGLCDQLEAARAGREAARDRLAAASLARLNAPYPETFQEDACFALDALPALTTRPDQIKRLRQTILNLAVRGKLVPQDAQDESASELLKRIAKEKARLVKAGEIKREKEQQPTSAASKPFELPEAWLWARFADVAAIQSNLVNPRGYRTHPHIAPDNIESGTGRLLPYDSISNAGVFSVKHHFKPGCILYSKIRPALAKVVLADFEGLCSADMYPLMPFIDRQYLQKFMLSEAFVRQSVSEDNRVAMPKINQEALAKILVAVPPLAEQYRIVAKVDALMTLCDRLEASLTATAATRRRLLDALLAEALAPVGARELEATE